MKKINLIFLGLFFVASFLFLGSSCNYSSDTKPSVNSNQPAADSSQPAVTQNNVSIENFSFNPQEIQVNVGTEVTFTNNDSTAHTVKSDSFDSGNLNPKDTFKYTFSNPGTYNYYCSLHPSMTGKVIVQ